MHGRHGFAPDPRECFADSLQNPNLPPRGRLRSWPHLAEGPARGPGVFRLLSVQVRPGPSALGFRVLVAEPGEHGHPVCAAVEQDPRLELVGCVEHAAAAVALATESVPDTLVVDEDLAGGGIAAAVEIGARLPGMPLVVAADAGEEMLVDALAAGASAYVSRLAPSAELAQTILEVAEGEVVLSRRQVPRIVGELRDPTRPRRRLERLPELTAREWQVFELMHSELTTPEIAQRLVVSQITVRSHARSIRNKLNRQRPVHH